MFSIATLALASPVYLRLVEGVGVWPLVRLVALLQIAPTLALWAIDTRLARLPSPTAWRAWRAALYVIALLSLCRQAQVSFVLPGEPLGLPARLVLGLVIAAMIGVVVAGFRWWGKFFAVFALPMAAWTLYVGVTIGKSSVADAAPRAPAAGSAPPVFVLLFDELDRAVFMRDGRIGEEWPGLRRLAGMSMSFADATANYGETCHSVATMLTGRLLSTTPPNGPRCLENVAGVAGSNLLTDLAARYRVRVYAQYLRYCSAVPGLECVGPNLGTSQPWLPLLQHWNPQGLMAAKHIVDPYHTFTLPLFDELLADIGSPQAAGTVHYLHLLLPHGPYVFDEDGGLHAPALFRPRSSRREYAATLRDYVRQARFVDRLVERFLARLDAIRLTDRAIVILTADHGLPSLEPFGPSTSIDGIEVNSARPRVPLMIHAAGLRPATTRADYQHRDFRALVSAALRGDWAAIAAWTPPGRVDGEKLFFTNNAWYVRDGAGRWVVTDRKPG